MKKKSRSKKKNPAGKKAAHSLKEVLSFYVKLANLEVHMNLLARLLTTLCIEKFGIRAGALKRLVRRIESEAVRDSQILELESLYKRSGEASKKAPTASSKPKDDPWDQIS
jgi:hypothetical protein